MKNLLLFVVALAAATLNAALPPVTQPPASPLREISALPGLPVTLAPGQSRALPPELFAGKTPRTLMLRLTTDAKRGGLLLRLPFTVDGKAIELTLGSGNRPTVWCPAAKARGEIDAGEPMVLAIGWDGQALQLHTQRSLAGSNAAPVVRLAGQAGELFAGANTVTLHEVRVYDGLFDHNSILKANFAVPGAGFPATAPAPTPREFPRPRLFADAATLAQIRERLAADPEYRRRFARYQTRFEHEIAPGPEKVEGVGEYKRDNGNRLIMLAMLYRLSGDPRYLAKAEEYLARVTDYTLWDSDKPYWTNFDLVTGHLLLGIAVAYDWLHAELKPELKQQIREVVRFRAGDFAARILSGRWTWGEQMLNNHGIVANTGLLAAAVAFEGEEPDARRWAGASRQWTLRYFAGQPRDGGDFEGIGYSEYSLSHVILYADLLRKFYGQDLYPHDPALRHALDFRIQSSLPEKDWGGGPGTAGGKRLLTGFLSFGDTRQRDFFVPDALAYKLGAEYRRGDLLGFADRIAAVDDNTRDSAYFSLLYFHQARQSGVLPTAPDYRRFAHYPDVDKAMLRSTTPGAESLLVFRCGPPAGHHALKTFTKSQGEGHVHPDVGGVTLFAAGELFWVNSDYCFKQTDQENTLLINGRGQIGEMQKWSKLDPYFQHKLAPKIVHTEHTENYTYVIGDATAAYPVESGLKQFRRHVLRLEPDLYVIADEVAAVRPSTFEIRFHSAVPVRITGPGAAQFSGKNGRLHFRTLLPREAKLQSFIQNVKLIDGEKNRPTPTLSVTTPQAVEKTLFLSVAVPERLQAATAFDAGMTDAHTLTVRQHGKSQRIRLTDTPDGLRLQVQP